MAIYSDLNAFDPEDELLLFDIDVIYSSIARILSTTKKTRFFRPRFGSNLQRLLFEPFDDITAIDIFTEIHNSLLQEDPRIIVDSSRTLIQPNYSQNKYEISIPGVVDGIEDSKFEFVGSLPRGV